MRASPKHAATCAAAVASSSSPIRSASTIRRPHPLQRRVNVRRMGRLSCEQVSFRHGGFSAASYIDFGNSVPVHPRGQGVHPSGQGSCDASVADEGGLYASQPPDLALLLAAEGTSLVGHRRLVSKGRAVLLPKVTPERFCVLQHGSRDAVMLGVFEPYPTQASRWLELE